MKELISFKKERCKDVAFPERVICKSEKDFFNKINVFNGKKERVYFSLYDCDEKRDYSLASVHIIGFDLDSENALDNLIKIWEYCKKNNYKSLYTFSTKGFWAYIFTKNFGGLKNRKGALYLATHYIAREIGLSISKNKDSDLDFHIIGDLARISRLPNGYDAGRKRFCIPITIEDMKSGYQSILEKSKKQCFNFIYYNSDFFDISMFDSVPQVNVEVDRTFEISFNRNHAIEDFLPCVRSWLESPELAVNKARRFFAVYCREIGIDKELCLELAKKYWGEVLDSSGTMTKFDEFVSEKQIEYAYSSNVFFPNCNTLIKVDLCREKCKLYAGDNCPLYKK